MIHIYLLIIDLQVYLNQHLDNEYLGFLLAFKRRDTLIILLLQDMRTFRVIKSNFFELWDITSFPVSKVPSWFCHLSTLLEDSSQSTFLSSWIFAPIYFCASLVLYFKQQLLLPVLCSSLSLCLSPSHCLPEGNVTTHLYLFVL